MTRTLKYLHRETVESSNRFSCAATCMQYCGYICIVITPAAGYCVDCMHVWSVCFHTQELDSGEQLFLEVSASFQVQQSTPITPLTKDMAVIL